MLRYINLATLVKDVNDLALLLELNSPIISAKIDELINSGQINLFTLIEDGNDLVTLLELNNSTIYKVFSFIPKEVINLYRKANASFINDDQQIVIKFQSIIKETKEFIEKRIRDIINDSDNQDLNARKGYNILVSEYLSSYIEQLEGMAITNESILEDFIEKIENIFWNIFWDIFEHNEELSNDPSKIKDIPKSHEEYLESMKKEIEKRTALANALHKALENNSNNDLLDESIKKEIISAIELGADPNIACSFHEYLQIPVLHGVATVLNIYSSKKYMLEVVNLLASYGANPYSKRYGGKDAFEYIKDRSMIDKFKEKIEEGKLEYEKNIKHRLEFIRQLNKDEFKIDLEYLKNIKKLELHAEVIQNKVNEICDKAENLLEFYSKENLRKNGTVFKLEQYEDKLSDIKNKLEKVEEFQEIELEIRDKIARLTSFEYEKKIIQQRLTEYSKKLSKYINDIKGLQLDEDYMKSLKKSLSKIDAELLKFNMGIKDVARELYMDGLEAKRQRSHSNTSLC